MKVDLLEKTHIVKKKKWTVFKCQHVMWLFPPNVSIKTQEVNELWYAQKVNKSKKS